MDLSDDVVFAIVVVVCADANPAFAAQLQPSVFLVLLLLVSLLVVVPLSISGYASRGGDDCREA